MEHVADLDAHEEEVYCEIASIDTTENADSIAEMTKSYQCKDIFKTPIKYRIERGH